MRALDFSKDNRAVQWQYVNRNLNHRKKTANFGQLFLYIGKQITISQDTEGWNKTGG